MINAKNTLALVCAMTAALPHPHAEAATGREGLEACVGALARAISESQGSAVQARISDESRIGRGRLANRSTFHLDARDPRSQEIVLRAECVVNARGKVRNLITLPADAPEAAERSL